MSNQSYWRSVPYLVTITMSTKPLLIRVNFHCCPISWSTCVQNVTNIKAWKKNVKGHKTKEEFSMNLTNILTLLSGGVKSEYWLLSYFNRHLRTFCQKIGTDILDSLFKKKNNLNCSWRPPSIELLSVGTSVSTNILSPENIVFADIMEQKTKGFLKTVRKSCAVYNFYSVFQG